VQSIIYRLILLYLNLMKKIFKKIIRNKYFLPFLIAFTYFCLLIECVTYRGFLWKHFFLDTNFLMTLLVIFLTFVNEDKRLTFKLNRFLFPVLVVFYFVLLSLDFVFYSNYVFSHFHIQPQNVLFLVLTSILILASEEANNHRLLKRAKENVSYFLNFLIIFFMLYLFIASVPDVFNRAIYFDAGIFTHLNFSYDDKMRNLWGDYYDFMNFVKSNTPADSSILVPPQDFMATVGNVGLDRYFLYPRKLGNGKLDDLSEANFQYVLIVPWWPRVELPAEKILVLNPGGGITEVFGNYEPAKIQNSWGIIKLKQ